MMDEQLIDEVALHGVIYNRQKYYLNSGANGGKYETKDDAWQQIAVKLHTDVDTCKKRWKYLRERYVSQRKQGDPPVYEHLSRPYLEKMKFLDQHIQPRKSYRHVPNFLTSPQSANSSGYSEYQVDKSNGSAKNVGPFGNAGQGGGHHYHQPDQQHAMNALSSAAASALENVNGQVKIEADQVFRDFAAAVASQQLQHISQSQIQQQAAAVAAVMADSSQGYQEPYKDAGSVSLLGAQNSAGSLTSTSSSMKSPLSSPLQVMGAARNPSQQQQPLQQHQQAQQQSPANGQQLPVVHSSSSAAGSSISTSSSLQMQQSHVYNSKDDMDPASSNFHMKKPRVQLNGNGHNPMSSSGGNGSQYGNDSYDDSDENSHDLMEPQVMMQHENNYSHSLGMQRGNGGNGNGNGSASANANGNNGGSGTNGGGNNNQQQQPQQQMQQPQHQPQHQHQNMFPSNTDFLIQLYQQLPHQASGSHPSNFGKFQAPPSHPGMQRLSEHLLGELVTTELLKMNKERKKSAQKRILEILFFDD
ncbi:hypothetical protein KR018_001164 [Drosophila ironensis]|nr:hypothetical protein KR018_001164 [Drosophila ironensis]